MVKLILLASFGFYILHLGIIPSQAEAKIHTEVIAYQQGTQKLEGYLAYDDSIRGKRPAILIFHDWMGLGPYQQGRAKLLAQMGYIAFAADIYGKDIKPKDVAEAAQLSSRYKLDRSLLRLRAQSAFNLMKADPRVDAQQIAAIGYCFGGTSALELARSGIDLADLVSFHGGLDSSDHQDTTPIKTKILILHGANDPMVPPKQVAEFTEEMKRRNVDWHLIAYGGAVHAFTNPDAGSDVSKGAAYNPKADHASWKEMKSFFKKNLKLKKPAS